MAARTLKERFGAYLGDGFFRAGRGAYRPGQRALRTARQTAPPTSRTGWKRACSASPISWRSAATTRRGFALEPGARPRLKLREVEGRIRCQLYLDHASPDSQTLMRGVLLGAARIGLARGPQRAEDPALGRGTEFHEVDDFVMAIEELTRHPARKIPRPLLGRHTTAASGGPATPPEVGGGR